MRLIAVLRFCLLALALFAAGCGPQDAQQGEPIALSPTLTPVFTPFPELPGLPPINPNAYTVTGTATFDEITFTADASSKIAGPVLVNKPLRFIDVEARDASGTVAVSPRTSTDANGKFTLAIKPDTDFVFVFIASATVTPQFGGQVLSPSVDVTPDFPVYTVKFIDGETGGPNKGNSAGAVALFGLAPITVFPSEMRQSGPFAILDAELDASNLVAKAAGFPLGPMTYLWSPDPALDVGFSAFVPDGTAVGLPGPLTLIKGGNSDFDNTDEYDADVIHHEYGHYVVNQLSRDSSLGGTHAPTDVLYPTLAYSEGVADWFATTVSSDPALLDNIAITGFDPLAVVPFNLDTPASGLPRGDTSESTVGEVLYDLTSGVEGRPDEGDGKQIPFATLLTALGTLQGSNVYVVLDDLLQALVAAGVQTTTQIQTYLVSENQNINFTGGDVFPQTITLGTTVNDTCTTIAANSGASTGADASNRFFKLDLASPATVNVTMTLLGGASGTNADGTNLDLYLLDTNNVTITTSQIQADVENVHAALPPGRYYINVSGLPNPFSQQATNATSSVVGYQLQVQ